MKDMNLEGLWVRVSWVNLRTHEEEHFDSPVYAIDTTDDRFLLWNGERFTFVPVIGTWDGQSGRRVTLLNS